MKKIIITSIVLILSIIFSNDTFSYTIDIIKPKPCPGFPSFIHSPAFIQQCEFIITKQGTESETILYKIFAEQHGNVLQMDEGICLSGETVYRSINLQNFTALCFNEVTAIRIEARKFDGSGIASTERGYTIVYKSELSCNYSSITNGSVELLTPSYIPVTFLVRCGGLSSGTFLVKRFRKTLTLYGNFRDSVPIVEKSLCLGYSGAGPNNQSFWAAKIDSSDTHATFITFTYEGYDMAGRYMGWWPCRPEQATVVFKYVRKPVMTNVTSYPNVINPLNHTSTVTCNLASGYENVMVEWKDSNTSQYPVYVTPLSHNQIRVSVDFRYFAGDEREENKAVFISSRGINFLGSTPWVRRKIPIINWIPNCPTIMFNDSDVSVAENSILVGSNGEFKEDHYFIQNPNIENKESIDFSIKETAKDISLIDKLVTSQVKVNKNEFVAVTEKGKVINYVIDADKTKIMKEDNTDVSEILLHDDGDDLQLKKGDKLNVTIKSDGNGYLVLSTYVPISKIEVAGIISTGSGDDQPFYSRDNVSSSCVQIDGHSVKNITISAEQDFSIDQLTFVNDLGTAVIKDLPAKTIHHTKLGDVSKLLDNVDGKSVHVNSELTLDLSYENSIDSEMKSYYLLSTYGRIIKSGSDLIANDKNVIESKPVNLLYVNSPNPFNPVTTIKYEIAADGFVNLKVYDISGRTINTLVSGYKKAGLHETVFDGSNIASGIYFYTIETNDYKETKRMILVK